MGMKEEIFSIATALGYDGATPTSKTKAVHAVAEAVESGGAGGGGDVGYDVTKVWAVPEQTVMSREITVGEGTQFETTIWGANVTTGDLAQMLADGQTDLTLVVDGTAYAATLAQQTPPSGVTQIVIQQDVELGGYGVLPLDETTYVINQPNDTEPTAHVVSCYYMSATTTGEFDLAVSTAVEKDALLVVTFTVNSSSSTITADKTPQEIYEADKVRGIPVVGRLAVSAFSTSSGGDAALFPITATKVVDGSTETINYSGYVFSASAVNTEKKITVSRLAYSGSTDTITKTSIGFVPLTNQN